MAVLWNQARVQGVRSEASKLLAMAQLEVDADPTAALAYVTKSLEMDDTEAARFLALRITQSAPPANVVPGGAKFISFSPTGEWLAALQGDKILLLNQDGREPVTLSAGSFPEGAFRALVFEPDGRTLAVGLRDELRLLSLPDGREIRRFTYQQPVGSWTPSGVGVRREGNRRAILVRPWDGAEERFIGSVDLSARVVTHGFAHDAMAYAVGPNVFIRSLARWNSPALALGGHSAPISNFALSKDGGRLVSVDNSGEMRIWDTASTSGQPLRVYPAPASATPVGAWSVMYGTARWIVSDAAVDGQASLRLWDLTAPPGAEPLVLRTRSYDLRSWAMDPLNRACVAEDPSANRLLVWPMPVSQPRVFDWHEGMPTRVAFTADGATLVASNAQGGLRAWPLSPDSSTAFWALPEVNDYIPRFGVSPTRREIVIGAGEGRVQVIPVDGGEPRVLEGLRNRARSWEALFSPDGRRVVAVPATGSATEKRIHVWDLETGALRVLEPAPKADDGEIGGLGLGRFSFVDSDRVVACVQGNGLMIFDLRDGKATLLSPSLDKQCDLAVARNRRVVVGAGGDWTKSGQVFRVGLDGSAPVPFPYRWEAGPTIALDPNENLFATTGPGSSVRIGAISGGEPYLLFGHRGGEISGLAYSPDGKWLASHGNDHTVRLWPVPDMTKIPPHKRSHEEFLSTLRTFTNLRAVPDPKAPNGWKLEAGPFPGWKDAPHW